jgi:predicted DsbA family dithiol-disulfide isomerase
METSRIQIDVFADLACPWCYIGERRLFNAIETLKKSDPGVHVNIDWRPFQLQPDLPQSTLPWKDFVPAKFGSWDRAEEMFEHVAAAGREDGAHFDFDKIAGAVNTLLAHRLILFAAEHGDPWPLIDRLFRAYFAEGEDIGDAERLVQIASSHGMEPAEVSAYLASDEGTRRVEATQELASRLGIEGVPFFVFDSSIGLSGAQPPEAFLTAFRQVLEGHPADS